MQQKEKTGFAKTFSIWFGLGALMFGTFCGANMASGVYASTYIVTLGGGWALVWLIMFFTAMSFFCSVGLNFVRSYKITNYNAYYLALYGLQKPGANPVLKGIVTVFFDIYTMMMGLVTVAATVALFSELMNVLLGIPTVIASIFGVLLFAVLSIYGAAFLRRFNTLMTISLIVSLVTILIAVISIRGPVLMERIGNFDIGTDWTTTTAAAHFSMFFSYCMTCSSWGSTLSNYSDQIRSQKDAIGSGITIGLLVTLLFAIYWVVVVLAVVSTAPSFTFNFSNRWATVWKTEKLSHKAKFFILSMGFLLTCWLISSVGLGAIVQKGYVMLGNVALFAVVIPLLISIYRVWKKEHCCEENGPEA